MLLRGDACTIREWRVSDLESLVRHANNRNIWINLRDRFPHPYFEEHGKKFLEHMTSQTPCNVWAIEVEGEAAGGIGIERLPDVEHVSAEIGYWLGEAFWNRGVATNALQMVTAQVFRTLDVTRILALPFADNIGSVRVLEKAGYVLEGTLRDSAMKDGQLRDQFLYAIYRRNLRLR
jgi:ribosomal-protein-alanine N-acetyltransferase